jgi:hypothetical protein
MQHFPRRCRCVDRTRSSFGETCRVVVMRMRQNDGRRGNRAHTMQPIAVDHDADTILLDQQRADATAPKGK